MSCVLELKNVGFVYGKGTPFEKRAVDGVSLQIEKGDLVGVIGHTGSGKSTLMQTLNGLIRPTDGQVLLDGKDIWEQPKKIRQIRFRVGMVFQYPEYQLFEETVYKDIAFGPQNQGKEGDELDKAVREAADFTGLKPELLQKSPFDLSGGEKRRAVRKIDRDAVHDEGAGGIRRRAVHGQRVSFLLRDGGRKLAHFFQVLGEAV